MKIEVAHMDSQNVIGNVPSRIEITYFKDTGKYYTSVEPVPILVREKFDIGDDPRKVIRQLNRDGNLPGLASGTWDGTVHSNRFGSSIIDVNIDYGDINNMTGHCNGRRGDSSCQFSWNRSQDDKYFIPK